MTPQLTYRITVPPRQQAPASGIKRVGGIYHWRVGGKAAIGGSFYITRPARAILQALAGIAMLIALFAIVTFAIVMIG